MAQSELNYITPVGFERLKRELHQLLHEARPQIVQVVSWAASNGDRSENGDYIYGKRRLREIDSRVRFLQKRLEIAEVVDPKRSGVADPNRVRFGATVQYSGEDDQERTVQIVGVDEIAAASGKISWKSPLGRALLNQVVGTTVLLQTPKGSEEITIVKVLYL